MIIFILAAIASFTLMGFYRSDEGSIFSLPELKEEQLAALEKITDYIAVAGAFLVLCVKASLIYTLVADRWPGILVELKLEPLNRALNLTSEIDLSVWQLPGGAIGVILLLAPVVLKIARQKALIDALNFYSRLLHRPPRALQFLFGFTMFFFCLLIYVVDTFLFHWRIYDLYHSAENKLLLAFILGFFFGIPLHAWFHEIQQTGKQDKADRRSEPTWLSIWNYGKHLLVMAILAFLLFALISGRVSRVSTSYFEIEMSAPRITLKASDAAFETERQNRQLENLYTYIKEYKDSIIMERTYFQMGIPEDEFKALDSIFLANYRFNHDVARPFAQCLHRAIKEGADGRTLRQKVSELDLPIRIFLKPPADEKTTNGDTKCTTTDCNLKAKLKEVVAYPNHFSTRRCEIEERKEPARSWQELNAGRDEKGKKQARIVLNLSTIDALSVRDMKVILLKGPYIHNWYLNFLLFNENLLRATKYHQQLTRENILHEKFQNNANILMVRPTIVYYSRDISPKKTVEDVERVRRLILQRLDRIESLNPSRRMDFCFDYDNKIRFDRPARDCVDRLKKQYQRARYHLQNWLADDYATLGDELARASKYIEGAREFAQKEYRYDHPDVYAAYTDTEGMVILSRALRRYPVNLDEVRKARKLFQEAILVEREYNRKRAQREGKEIYEGEINPTFLRHLRRTEEILRE